MKYLWVSSVFAAGLILGGGSAFAESDNIVTGRAQNLSESQLLLADASIDLDITMEVVDEDVQSSKDITNIIELPLRSQYREGERPQEQPGNGPEFSNGPGEGQGHGPNPFTEGKQDSQQNSNRPDDAGQPDAVSRPDDAGRPDTVTDNAGRPDTVTDNAGRPDTVSPGEMDNRDNASAGPSDSGAKGDATQKQEIKQKGN
ncbi:MAG: hypothetical protein AB1545_17065 [Thermodesulfobacteriota bacterium]